MRKWTCCSLPIFSPQQHLRQAAFLIVLIACKNGSLIAAQKKFLDKFSGLHLQRIRIGQGAVGRIAKKRIFHLDFIAALNDGAGNTFLTIRRNCA
jgi:hypothetical protein